MAKTAASDRLMEEIDKDPLLAGVTFSGGEPFCQAEMFTELAEKVREKGLSVTVFSGYTYEQLLAMAEKDVHVKRLLELTDLLWTVLS